MPDFSEKAVSISCCGAVRVGTGLEEGVGAGATNALRISSVVAIRMKSWSFTMHKLSEQQTPLTEGKVLTYAFYISRIDRKVHIHNRVFSTRTILGIQHQGRGKKTSN